jgi:hypothetical protein
MTQQGGEQKTMASAEVNARPQPLFWKHAGAWISALPRSALLSMVGPLILCVVGYVGWRNYGAQRLDMAYYGLKKENVHITPQDKWMRTSNVLDDIFKSNALANVSLLDSQTPVLLARVFDAHPCVRKTLRVERMAGQVMVKVEYRSPVAMVARFKADDASEKLDFFPIDVDSVLLNTENFTDTDVPNYITIYPDNMKSNGKLVNGKPFGDSGVADAAKLCWLLQPIREAAKITKLYVYPKTPQVGKSKWWLELETVAGPRIEWGSAPGMEGLGEPTADLKLKQLLNAAADSKIWSQKSIVLTGQTRTTSN